MDLFKWVDKGIKNMKWYDISLIKATTLFFTLFILVVWEKLRVVVLLVEWHWYFILTVICAYLPMKRFFRK